MRNILLIISLFLGLSVCSQGNFTLVDSTFQEKQSLTTYRIQFEFDKANIRPASFPFLDSVVTFLQKHDSLILEVRNHRDTRGSNKYGSNLTQKRAQSVVKYLIEKGIEKERLVAKGYGDTQPLVPVEKINTLTNKSEQENAHQKNRRMEFVILKTDFVPLDKK